MSTVIDSEKNGKNAPSAKPPTIDLAALMGMDYARFSALLPYRYVDSAAQLFINRQSLGFACELLPLVGANESIIHGLADMLKGKLDPSVTLQVLLVGNGQVDGCLQSALDGYFKSDPAFRALGLSQARYFRYAAIHGFRNKRQLMMPLRHYRCFLMVSKRCGYNTVNAERLCTLREEIRQEFKNAGLDSATMTAVGLIALLKTLLNPSPARLEPPTVKLDAYRELHEQVVEPETAVTVFPDHVAIRCGDFGETRCVALALKSLPDEIALWSQPNHFANIFRANIGIACPFVISVHVKLAAKEKSKLKAFRKASSYEKKANSPYAKLIPGTVDAARDWKKIRDDLASDAVQLCQAHYSCVLFTDAAHQREHTSQALAAFRLNGMELYPVRYQQLPSYLAVLPFVLAEGLWQDFQWLGRLNTMTTWNLTNLLPLVADYQGFANSRGVLAPTFRYQMACIDTFHPSLDNYNVCVTATSGSGKSVLSQSVIASVLADGGKAWVIDLGQSYKKFCELLGGTYLDLSNLKLNPFSSITDISYSAESVRDLLAVMASPNTGLSDVQKAHLLDAVMDAYQREGKAATVDAVIRYLQSIDQTVASDLRIHDMVVLLKKYSVAANPVGTAAVRIFNETSELATTNPQKERFVVLELGELENQPDLLKAVLFALILNIEAQMYHADQRRKKLCVIDEAWRLLSGSNKTAAAFIEKGFRTARKHKGAFMTITQKINDFYASAEAQAAWSCAENKIVMRQNEKAFKDFLTEQPEYFSEYEQRLIQGFRPSSENGFSEFMVQQGSITSFHRLFLDPFSRVMMSSRAEDHQAVTALVQQGLSLSEAILRVAQTLYGDELAAIDACAKTTLTAENAA